MEQAEIRHILDRIDHLFDERKILPGAGTGGAVHHLRKRYDDLSVDLFVNREGRGEFVLECDHNGTKEIMRAEAAESKDLLCDYVNRLCVSHTGWEMWSL